MQPKTAICATVVASMVVVSSNARAALIDRGGGLIYDSDLNITWLSDASYAVTSGFDADGKMTWYQAESWIQSLNASTYRGVSGWRLPGADVNCGANYSCTTSEMGHLFYLELGGRAHDSILDISNTSLGLFEGVAGGVYWSQTVVPASDGDDARFDFNFALGWQDGHHVTNSAYAWAVHDGDIALLPAAVPLPASVWLLSSGLLALLGASRKESAQ